jgi:hypothetical protein
MIPVSIFSIIVILVQVFNKSSIVVFLRKHRNFKSRQDFFIVMLSQRKLASHNTCCRYNWPLNDSEKDNIRKLSIFLSSYLGLYS